jgi:hypothetical protein
MLKSRSHIHVVKPSWVGACRATNLQADEDGHKAFPRSGRSMQALVDLLAETEDASSDGFGLPQNPKKTSDNLSIRRKYEEPNHNKLNPDEVDAPDIVWDASQPAPRPLPPTSDVREKENKAAACASSVEREQRTSKRVFEKAGSSSKSNNIPSNALSRTGSSTNLAGTKIIQEIPQSPIFKLSGLGTKVNIQICVYVYLFARLRICILRLLLDCFSDEVSSYGSNTIVGRSNCDRKWV